MTLQETHAVPSPQMPVSSGNPCPFLRALVAGGWLNDDVERLTKVRDTLLQASGQNEKGGKILVIAAIANGLSPAALLRNVREGLHLSMLRDGPLNKHGSGSRILDAHGQFQPEELQRLASFASPKRTLQGDSELGLSSHEVTAMMDANFERARAARRRIDRALMDGEWPVLLEVLGKDDADGARYLGVEDVRALFQDRRLPQRLAERLA